LGSCIIPRCKRRPTKHHFPIKKADEGTLTIEICRLHHNRAEEKDKETLDIIATEAPFYWIKKRMWDEAQEPFMEWLKEYKENR
jgi:hypothetical protein